MNVPYFENISLKTWKADKRRRTGWIRLYLKTFWFRYSHNDAFRTMIDSALVFIALCLLIVILVVCGFYYANPEPMPTLWNR